MMGSRGRGDLENAGFRRPGAILTIVVLLG
jgi:hypothetical protein